MPILHKGYAEKKLSDWWKERKEVQENKYVGGVDLKTM
jgi:hypothetical protein